MEGKLVVEKLDSNECYILDCWSELYVFIGKTSSSERRNIAIAKANSMLEAEKAERLIS